MFLPRGQRQRKTRGGGRCPAETTRRSAILSSDELLFCDGRASSTSVLRTHRVKASVLCLLALSCVAAAGCGGAAAEGRTGGALQYTEDAKRAYDKAMLAFEEHDWEEARRLFKDIKKRF